MKIVLFKKVQKPRTGGFYPKQIGAEICKRIDRVIAEMRNALDPAIVVAIGEVEVCAFICNEDRDPHQSGYQLEDLGIEIRGDLKDCDVTIRCKTPPIVDVDACVQAFVNEVAHRLNLRRAQMADDLTLLNGLISKLTKEKK